MKTELIGCKTVPVPVAPPRSPGFAHGFAQPFAGARTRAAGIRVEFPAMSDEQLNSGDRAPTQRDWRRSAVPLLLLILFTLVESIASAASGANRVPISKEATLFGSLCWSLVVVWWVVIDRKGRRLNLPYEFDAFVFFGWIAVVPYYLYKTRGRRGWLQAVAFWVLTLFPGVVRMVALAVARGR